MYQDVFIIGATGKVGNKLVEQIFELGDTNPSIHENPTRIVGLASSQHTLYVPQGISRGQAYRFTNRNFDDAQGYSDLSRLLEISRVGFRDDEAQLVFIDVTALNEPMTKFHLQVIEQTHYGLVTANKNPLALSDYATFQKLTQDARRYGFICSVMAGAEAVRFVRDARDLNDHVHLIEGCFSGTNGYISSELETGKPLSQIVKDAYEKGYTEPHPRDDLNGLDVVRKLVVMARSAGLNVSIGDVKVRPFIPEAYLQEDNVGKFLDSLLTLDSEFNSMMESARLAANTFRYVAVITNGTATPTLEVALQEVTKNGPLGSLEGTMNKIIITTGAYPRGYVVEAPGAGLEVTARNVRRDLLDLLPHRKMRA